MKRCLLPLLLLLAATLPELLPAQAFIPTTDVPSSTQACASGESSALQASSLALRLVPSTSSLGLYFAFTRDAYGSGTPVDVASSGFDVSYERAYRFCATTDCDQTGDWSAWTTVTPNVARASNLASSSGTYRTVIASKSATYADIRIPNGATVEVAGRYLEYKSGNTPACAPWYKDSLSTPVKFGAATYTVSIDENASGATPIDLGTFSASTSGYGTIPKLDSNSNPLPLYSLSGDGAADFAMDDSGALTYTGSGLDYESKSSYTLTLTADNENPTYRTTGDGEHPTALINGGTDTTTVIVNVVDLDESRVQSLTVGTKTVTAANSGSDFLLAKALDSYQFEVAAAPAKNPAITGYRWDLSSDWPTNADTGAFMTTANNRTIDILASRACGAATPTPTSCNSDSGNMQKGVLTVNVQASATPNPDVATPTHWGPVETFTVVVVPNGGPVFNDATLSLSLAEHKMGDGTPVELGQVMATDPEGDPVAYCLAAKGAEDCPADDANPNFALSPGGVLTYTGTGEEFDTDTPPVYSLTIYAESRASSPGGAAYADYYGEQATYSGGNPVSCRPCRRIQATVTVTVTDVNDAPTVNAGPDQEVLGGALVTLAGSSVVSSLRAGNAATYGWTSSPSGIALSGNTVLAPTFTAPALADGVDEKVWTLTLTVVDASGQTATDSVVIKVVRNRTPLVFAGPDIEVFAGVTVTLDGSGSRELDTDQTLSYLWTQVSGDTVPLSATDRAVVSFTAPALDGDLEFELKVTDNHSMPKSATDRVLVSVKRSYEVVGENILSKQALSLAIDVNSALSGRLDAVSSGQASLLRRDGTAFALPLVAWDTKGGGRGGSLGLWGRLDDRSLSDSGPDLSWDGDNSSTHLGVDWRVSDSLLVGLLVSETDGSFSYEGQAAGSGRVSSELSGQHPYFGWISAGGLKLWGSLGFGSGSLKVSAGGGESSSDSDLGTVLLGVGKALGAVGKLEIGVRGEYSSADLDLAGSDDGAIKAMTVSAGQLRLTGVGRLPLEYDSGAMLTPSLDVALRSDSGDGTTGSGLELGINLDYASGNGFLTVAGGFRTMLTTVGDYEESGTHLLVRLMPGSGGRGLSFTLSPSQGETSSESARLWSGDLSALASGGVLESEERMGTEVGYGLSLSGGGLVLTPYSGGEWRSGGARTVFAGARLAGGGNASLSLRTERGGGVAADSRTVLSGTVSF